MISIRKFYDRWIDGSYGAYKDVDGDWVEHHISTHDKATTGYWVICTQSYETEGQETPKGRMSYHTSKRAIVNPKWRKATQHEIDTKQNLNGNWFNLTGV